MLLVDDNKVDRITYQNSLSIFLFFFFTMNMVYCSLYTTYSDRLADLSMSLSSYVHVIIQFSILGQNNHIISDSPGSNNSQLARPNYKTPLTVCPSPNTFLVSPLTPTEATAHL